MWPATLFIIVLSLSLVTGAPIAHPIDHHRGRDIGLPPYLQRGRDVTLPLAQRNHVVHLPHRRVNNLESFSAPWHDPTATWIVTDVPTDVPDGTVFPNNAATAVPAPDRRDHKESKDDKDRKTGKNNKERRDDGDSPPPPTSTTATGAFTAPANNSTFLSDFQTTSAVAGGSR